MAHLKMLSLCAISVVLFCSNAVDGVGCLSSQSAFDLPVASASAVHSFEEAARNGTAIFPELRFRCSGIVTHVNMSFHNRTQLCSAVQGGTFPGQNPSAFHIQLSVWEAVGQDSDYRYLGQHRLAVAAEEVARQCQLQQQASVAVQFALDSQLLVEPGYTIGFHYPFAYSITVADKDLKESLGIDSPKSALSIEFVEATLAAAILTQESQLSVNAIAAVEQTQFNITPKVGFSMDVSSVGASGSTTSPAMLEDHVVILSATVVVAFFLALNGLLLCIVLLCVSRKIRKNQKNGGPHEYTYPRFSLPNGRHSRRAPIPPPRPQVIRGPQEDYEYVSSTPPDHNNTHLEDSNMYI